MEDEEGRADGKFEGRRQRRKEEGGREGRLGRRCGTVIMVMNEGEDAG